MKSWIALSVGVLLGGNVCAGELSVPLKVTEPAGLARANWPVSGGVPVGPLKVKEAAELVLQDGQGAEVAAQISPTVKREDGTLVWVLVDFLADLKAGETKAYTLIKGKAEAKKTKNAVETLAGDEKIVLANGLMKVEIPRGKFNLFSGVWLDPAGEGKYRENVLAAEQPAALTLVRGKDKAAFSSRDGKVEKVTLEDAGPVRTTVRVDGDYGDGKGGTWLKYTARITAWAGSTDLRVLYAIRNVNAELDQQEQIRKATVALRLFDQAGVKDYLLGGGSVGMSRLTKGEQGTPKGSQWHHTVRLSQVGAPEPILSKTHRTFYKLTDFEQPGFRVEQFQPGDRRPHVDVGYKCKGWLDLMGDRGGCLFFYRTFTYDVPKAMEAKQDGTLSLEVIPEYEGKNQPYYEGGGYWLGDRTYRSYDLFFHFHDKTLLTEADWKQWGEVMSCYAPPTAATAAAADGAADRLKNPLVLASTPEWYTRTGELWGEVPSLEDEAAAARAMGFDGVAPARPDARHDLALDFIHYENYHYRSEWDEPGDSILEFLRTGEWTHFRRARGFGDNYRDLGVPRTDGMKIGQRGQGAKGAGPILRWGKFCGCHKYGSGVIDLWLATGDRSYLDAGVDFGYDEAVEHTRWAGFGNRDWGRQMIGVLRTYQVTRDPKLKAYLVKYCTPRLR